MVEEGVRAVEELDFDTWLKYGIDHRFIGPPVCATHDGTPTSESEDVLFDEGWEPCISVVRLYIDDDHAVQVEANHSPSVWRHPHPAFGRK